MGAVVPRLFPGETIACLATGPSLTLEDVEQLQGKARVVAVSDAVRYAPWADVLYSADYQWWRWHTDRVAAFQGLKVSIDVGSAKRPNKHPQDVRLLAKATNTPLSLDPSSLALGMGPGRNSGYQAINLAVHLGAQRILLLGYDLQRGATGSHFFGEHPHRKSPPLGVFAQRFPDLVQPLKTLWIEIVNCSRQTALTCFPRMPLDAALA